MTRRYRNSARDTYSRFGASAEIAFRTDDLADQIETLQGMIVSVAAFVASMPGAGDADLEKAKALIGQWTPGAPRVSSRALHMLSDLEHAAGRSKDQLQADGGEADPSASQH